MKSLISKWADTTMTVGGVIGFVSPLLSMFNSSAPPEAYILSVIICPCGAMIGIVAGSIVGSVAGIIHGYLSGLTFNIMDYYDPNRDDPNRDGTIAYPIRFELKWGPLKFGEHPYMCVSPMFY